MPRIVGGAARGRRLAVPRGEGVRPTTDKVREALFNVLRHRFGDPLDGARVLDLFAGAGTLGLEALSRGAASVTLVEADRRHAAVLRQNVEAVAPAVDGRAQVAPRRVEAFLAEPGTPHDVVFLDPPYAAGAVGPTLARLVGGGWLAASALICVEHPVREAVEPPPGLAAVFRREYGSTAVTLLERAPT